MCSPLGTAWYLGLVRVLYSSGLLYCALLGYDWRVVLWDKVQVEWSGRQKRRRCQNLASPH